MEFKEIRLQTKKLSALQHFYNYVLDLPVTEVSAGSFCVQTQITRLIFEQQGNVSTDPFYHFAFNIPSNKIDEAYKWLKERTNPLWIEDYNSYIADFRNWKAQSVYFMDPAGNIAEFIARADLKDIADDPFSSKHIRSISEIGLVFPKENFKQSIQKILDDYRLTYFDKQPPLENFCAIGDDQGLFIAVPEHRSWYPCTDKPARIFPIRVIISVKNEAKSIEFS